MKSCCPPVEKMDYQCGDIVNAALYKFTDSDVDAIEEARFLQGILSVTAVSINEAFNAAAGFTSQPGRAIRKWLEELQPAWNALVEKLETLKEDKYRVVYAEGESE